MKGLLELLGSLCSLLGIEVSLAEGQALPPTLEGRLTSQIGKLTTGNQQFNAIAQDLQDLAPYVACEGENSLSAAEIIKRLPGRLELAKHGESYLETLRTEAAKWYGLSCFGKENREPSDREKRQTARIKGCCSVEELADWIEEFRPAGQNSLGKPMRSSQAEKPWGEPKSPDPGREGITESAKRMHMRGDE